MTTKATSQSKTPSKKGRPALFDPDRVVEQVADLFWARGFDGVSMSDITAATGLSKSSLYNSFSGKDALFKTALKQYYAQSVQAGADWLTIDDGIDPIEKLDQFFASPADDVHGRGDARGCFMCNTSADGLGRAPDIDTLVGSGFAKLEAGLITLFTRYAPNADSTRIQNAARLALTSYTGLRIRSRSKPPRTEFDSVRTATVQAVQLMLQ